MDYKERTLEERIELASRYALLLMSEAKTNKEIVNIIKRDFALAGQQAAQAFEAARTGYNNEPFFDEINKSLVFGAGLIVFFILLSICIGSSS